MAATYTVRINGVDRAQTHVLLENFSINEITNGINTATFDVESEDASYRPVKRQSVEIEEDDGSSPVRLIFGGVIRMVRERGFGQPADGIDDIIQTISADSYKTLAQRRFITETIPAGTLKAALQVIVTYLQDFGAIGDVTLDPAQVDGPTLEAIDWKVIRVDEALNFLATLTAKYGAPFTWDISYEKILGMYQTGTVAAPWNLIESTLTVDESQFGDVESEPTDDNYANKITVIWGNGSVIDLGFDGLNTPQVFTGDGVTNTFTLTYQLLGPIPAPPVTSPVTQSAVGYAFVNVPGGLIEFLASTGTVGAEWEYDSVTNSVSRVAGPPPLGYVFSVPYRGLLTGEVTAEDAAEIAANGLWEDKILAPEIEDPVLALTVAQAELARRVNTGRVVRFVTRRMPGPQPGQTITITVPKRNISGSFTVTDVQTETDAGNVNALIRRVTCNSTVHEQSHQTLTRWWSEKDTAGISNPAAASAVPDWPLNSVQWNDNWTFGGAAYVLYGDLFWSQPDIFTSPPEVQSKGLIFVQNQDIGDAGHIGLTDPQRTEMGMIGEGDFSVDTFGIDASMLLNATGDIIITAGTGEGSPGSPGQVFGSVTLVGNQSIVYDLAHLGGIDPGVSTLPGDIGDSFSRFHRLNVIDGIAAFYNTVATLPYTINTTTASDTNEFLGFVVTANTGTIFLPFHASAGSPDYRIFPTTAVGRYLYIVNAHASGTLTVDAGTAGSNIGGDSTITLASRAAVLLVRHDTGWKIWGSHGTVTGGGGGGGGTPGGANKDIQYNDGGSFGGDSDFTFDETTGQVLIKASSTSSHLKIVNPFTTGSELIGFLVGTEYEELEFGSEWVSGSQIARSTAPGFLYHINHGSSGASPSQDSLKLEINPGEDPGSPMSFAFGRGLEITAEGIAYLYQYGGLGTGGVTGVGLEIDNNTSGNGAAGYLGLKTKSGTLYYIWVDDNGCPRIATAPPQEDGTPSDTSGDLIGECVGFGSGGSGSPACNCDIQDLLDTISTEHGAIIFYNGTDWVALSPDTAGYVLTTNGASADPTWEAQTGGSGSPSPLETVIVLADADDSDADDTLHDDPELFFSVEANAVYLIEFTLIFTSGTSNTPDAKFRFTLPASATLTSVGTALITASTTTGTLYQLDEYQATTPTFAFPIGVLTSATSQASSGIMTAVLRTAGTSGTVQLQWAQNTTTGGTPTVRKADSYIKYIRVS